MTDNVQSAEQLRERAKALFESGEISRNQLAREAGIAPSQFSGFLKREDEQGLSASKLVDLARTIDKHESASEWPLPPNMAQTLGNKLRDGKLVLFAGAGLSLQAPAMQGRKKLPMWGELAKQLYQQFELDDPDLLKEEPLEVFDEIIELHGRNELELALQKALDDSAYGLSLVHERIAELNWHSVVTTNYDNLLARAFRTQPVVVDSDYERLRQQPPPKLFHLHGDLRQPQTLTSDDYRLWPQHHPRAWAYLKKLALENTLLFVGYSLSDPHIKYLFDWLRAIRTDSQSNQLPAVHYAWLWQSKPGPTRRFGRKNGIQAHALWEQGDWLQALEQIAQLADSNSLQVTTTAFAANHSASTSLAAQADMAQAEQSRYRSALRAKYNLANLQGLYLPDGGYSQTSITLEDIFVEPDVLVAETPQPNLAKLAKESNPRFAQTAPFDELESDSPSELSAKQDSEECSQLSSEQQLLSRTDIKERRIALSEAFADSQHIILLGDAGQGKTSALCWWLLQAVEAWHANPAEQPCPIYIRLASWENQQQCLADALKSHDTSVNNDIYQQWTTRPVLWLLDGMDEIRDPYQRERFREQLTSMRAERPQDRFIVSSRPAGYQATGLSSDWQLLHLAPLNDTQAQGVLECWQQVIGKVGGAQENYNAATVLEQLKQQASMSYVLKNSLLLTLVIQFLRRNKILPQDRSEFYADATRTFTGSWLRFRLTNAARQELPSEDLLEHFLCTAALHGMRQGIVNFSLHQIQALAEPIVQQYGRSDGGDMQRLIEAAESIIGVFVAKAPNQFGFLHLSFQEYYAAKALAKLSNQQTGNIIRDYWDIPEWRETWAFYVLAIAERPDSLQNFIQAVQADVQPEDQYLFRPQLFLAELLGVGRQEHIQYWPEFYSEVQALLRSQDERLQLAILEPLQKWERVFPSPLIRDLTSMLTGSTGDDRSYVRAEVVEALNCAVSQRNVQQLLQGLLTGGKRDDSSYVQTIAIEALSGAVSQRNVQQILLGLLKDSTRNDRGYVQHVAVRALSGAVSQGHVQQLLQGLVMGDTRDESESVRSAAVRALSGAVSQGDVQQLLQGLVMGGTRDDSEYVRSAAVRALSGAVSQGDVQQLLQGLVMGGTRDDSEYVRYAAVEALSVVVLKGDVQQKLQCLLTGDTRDDNDNVRNAAVEALSVVVSQGDVQQLLQGLVMGDTRDDSQNVRRVAVEALSGAVSQGGVQQLLQGLVMGGTRDDSEHVRSAAVRALSGAVSQGDVQQLLQGLVMGGTRDDSEYVRYAAVEALSVVVLKGDVQQKLQCLLTGDTRDDNDNVRNAAVEALSVVVSQGDVQQLLQGLVMGDTRDDSEDVRVAAVEAMHKALVLRKRQRLL